jgi:Putative zinc-finger
MRRHRADWQVRAWLDGELPPWRRLALRLHLSRCERCRTRTAEIEAERRLLSHLLVTREPPLDVGEAWVRFQVRSGHASRRPTGGRQLAGALLVAGLALVTLPLLPRRSGWSADVEWLLHPTPVKAKTSSTGDTLFVERLLRLEAAGRVHILEDACCEDRDGEGPADDGLAIVRVAGRDATLAVLYEDLDDSGALTAGDLIRLVSRMADRGPKALPQSPA